MSDSALETESSLFAQPGISGTGFDTMLAQITPARGLKVEPPTSRAPFKWSTELAIGAGFNLLHARYSASFKYLPEKPDESLIFRFCGAGAAETTIRGKKVANTKGTVVIAPWFAMGCTTVQPDAREGGSAASTFIGINPSIVNDCLRDMFPGSSLKQLELMPLLDLHTLSGRTLASMCSGLVQGLTGQCFLEGSSKTSVLICEAIVRFVFALTDHPANEYGRTRSPSIVPRHVKRAIDFMHANMHRPIRLVDIAYAAGVSSRALQLGFAQFCETTPIAYLRQIRLQAVHAELSAIENNLPVQEVALKWGFTHMGRFAAQFRATFGETPSVTARRSAAL